MTEQQSPAPNKTDQLLVYRIVAGGLRLPCSQFEKLESFARFGARLDEAVLDFEAVHGKASSVAGITPLVAGLLESIRSWTEDGDVGEVRLAFTVQVSGGRTRPESIRLLPMDRVWLETLAASPWSGPSLPMFTMPAEELFTALTHEYLFAGLFRAAAQSLAGENAMRLASMQGAEKNIEERREELAASYQMVRQTAITSEFLDIVSGFEALR